jgi:hypothetical protein
VNLVSIERIKIENEQELEEMVTREIGQIEKDLTVICNHVPINGKSALDILCHDENGQLVIMQLSVNEDDNILLQGIQSLDYVQKFRSFLKATYNKHKIDDNEKPRLILIAPSFSGALRNAVEAMKGGMRVDLYEWEYLKLGDHKGLRLQSLFAWKPSESVREVKDDKQSEKKREVKPAKKKEPELEAEKEEDIKAEAEPEPPQPEVPQDDFPSFLPPKPEKPQEQRNEGQQKKKLKLF